MALTGLSYSLSEHDGSPGIALLNCFLSLAAIGVTAFIAVQSQSREMALSEQAGLLDLTHDAVFVRDMNDVTYWNRGADELYGWKRGEAVGKITHQLMQTIFPIALEEIMAELFRTGRWEGELVHMKKDGRRANVASRWSVQRTHGAILSRSWRPITTSLSASRPKMPCGEAMCIWRKRRN
jgi:PAS domain S-box-containing protein